MLQGWRPVATCPYPRLAKKHHKDPHPALSWLHTPQLRGLIVGGHANHFLWLTKLRQRVSDDRAVPASKKSSKLYTACIRVTFLSGRLSAKKFGQKWGRRPNRHAFINQIFTQIEKVKIYCAQPSPKITGPRFPRENFSQLNWGPLSLEPRKCNISFFKLIFLFWHQVGHFRVSPQTPKIFSHSLRPSLSALASFLSTPRSHHHSSSPLGRQEGEFATFVLPAPLDRLGLFLRCSLASPRSITDI